MAGDVKQDAELIDRIRSGDRAACEELVVELMSPFIDFC